MNNFSIINKYFLLVKLKLIAHEVEDNFLLKALLSTPLIDKLLRDNRKTSKELLKELNNNTKCFKKGTVIIYLIKFTEYNGIFIEFKSIPLSYLLLNLVNYKSETSFVNFKNFCKIFVLFLTQNNINIIKLNKKKLIRYVYIFEGVFKSLNINKNLNFSKEINNKKN